MATRISYQIGGKYDSSGEKNALTGLKNLGESAKKLNTLFAGFAGAKIMQGLKSVLDGATESFRNQNKAVQNLNVSLSKNMKVTTKDADKLKSTLDDLGRGNFFDADTLNNAAALASNMGLNADQIEEVMKAATDMTAAGLMPMDQAVKALSASYSGNITQLKKYAPELANLTDEELKNGAAVSKLADNYKGYADAMAETFSGRDTRFKNAFSDLQAAAGGIKESFDFLLKGKLIEPLNKVTQFLTDNRDNIIKFVLALPKLAETVLKNIWELIRKTFTIDGLINLGKMLVRVIAEALKTIVEIAKVGVQTVFDLIDLTIGNIFRIINNVIMKIGNAFLEMINKAIFEAAKNPVFNFLMESVGIDTKKGIEFRFQEKKLVTFDQFISNLGDRVNNLVDGFKATGKDFKNIFGDFTGYYKDENQQFVQELKDVLDKTELPEDLKKALTSAVVEAAPILEEATEEKEKSDSGQNNTTEEKEKSKIEDALSPFVNFAKSFTDLAAVGEDLAAGFLNNLAAINSVSMILNYVNTLLDGVFIILTPLIDSLLTPLVGLLNILGQMIGQLFVPILEAVAPVFNFIYELMAQVLNILQPIVALIQSLLYILMPLVILLEPLFIIIEALSNAFAALINLVLVPVAKAIGGVVDFIYNGFVRIINGIISAINRIPFVNVGYLGYSNIAGSIGGVASVNYTGATLTTTGQALTGSSSASSSASYSGARDITVNIYFSQSYVNGDAREIAINLRNEIRSAEALGY